MVHIMPRVRLEGVAGVGRPVCSIGPIRWSESWLKLVENTVLVELLEKKNTVPVKKISRTSRI